jgi:hypothetical protein
MGRLISRLIGPVLTVWTVLCFPLNSTAAIHCLAPVNGEEITLIECDEMVADPRCQTPCDYPPCTGYNFPVRPAKKFRWFSATGNADYRITVENLISGDTRTSVLTPSQYRFSSGVCETYMNVSVFLPQLDTPAGTIPMIGVYRWHLDTRVEDKWIELDSNRFVYLFNANPFGSAVIDFRWQTEPGLDFCGQAMGPADFWIHLPIEYPDNRPGRSPYEWGYLFIQATDDLLPVSPEMGSDYTIEYLPVPGEPDCDNILLWLRYRVPSIESQLAYHLMFTLEDPWSDLSWDIENEFDLTGTQMPLSKSVWPVEFLDAGYLDEGNHTAPLDRILEMYVWCDPYPRCVRCPWSDNGQWCEACWEGPEGDFCLPDPWQQTFDPENRTTWKGLNALEWIRTNHLFNSGTSWSVDDNLRALDRLMSRWPARFMDQYYPGMDHTAMYNSNDLLRLCDPETGLVVWDHWRYTDAQPMEYLLTGLGCSNASTHLGLSMARLLNFPARSVCMAHYHDDVELWLPHGPPKGLQYCLDEGEWIRFVGEHFAAPDWDHEPPDPAGGGYECNLPGMLKTTSYISWNSEDSIPFNWYLSSTEPLYRPCKARLTDRQWPYKLTHLVLPDETVRLIIVHPSLMDFSAGEGMETIRNLECSEDLSRWILLQHLIPLGAGRAGYVLDRSGELAFIVVNDDLEITLETPVVPGEILSIEEPSFYFLRFKPVLTEPYLFLEIADYDVNWDRADPLPTPRPTPTATQTPVPTETPTPAPLGVTLDLPQTHFLAGDEFYLKAKVSNPGERIPSVHLFILLQIGNQVYFGPSWSRFDRQTGEGIDSWNLNLDTGDESIQIIPAFAWPQVSDPAEGLLFIAAIMDSDLTGLIGNMDQIEWGYE